MCYRFALEHSRSSGGQIHTRGTEAKTLHSLRSLCGVIKRRRAVGRAARRLQVQLPVRQWTFEILSLPNKLVMTILKWLPALVFWYLCDGNKRMEGIRFMPFFWLEVDMRSRVHCPRICSVCIDNRSCVIKLPE